MDNQDWNGEVHLLWVGIIVEGGLIVVALLLAWLGIYDQNQPLTQWTAERILTGVAWGTVATLPLLLYLAVFHFWKLPFLKPMRDFVALRLHPLFRNTSLFEMAILSLLAGVGEELLFRWCLQGGISWWLAGSLGVPLATAAGLLVASVLFGLCHWVNRSYGITTLVVGLYLGGIMLWTGSVLVPIVAHALFDFLAMIYIGAPRFINRDSLRS